MPLISSAKSLLSVMPQPWNSAASVVFSSVWVPAEA